MKVYGPYTRKDGRKHVILYENGTRTTVSYPKWLMEQHLGRKLHPFETVDHLDRDFRNNDLSNLEVKPRRVPAAEDTRRAIRVSLPCVSCGAPCSSRRVRVIQHYGRKGKAGPFCSKRCVGKYGAAIQNGASRLPPQSAGRAPGYYRRQKTRG